ncbi:MAG: hypothetical protein LBB76_05020 [Azoarcus sp.]|jgi:hypothetical protein|nr:hypothetical protein [Azoarcus sp.]
MNDAKLALLIGTVVATAAAPIVAGIMQARSRAQNKQSIPEEQYNALITDVNALHPGDPPLDVPAKAGNNIMRITEDHLFVRTASGSMYGGRASMSWWATFLTTMILLFPLMSLLDFLLDSLHYLLMDGMSFHDSFFTFGIDRIDREDILIFLGILLFWSLAMSWIFVGWRRQLPIIFNRKARTVTCWLGNRLCIRNWDEMTAYSKGGIVVTYGGGSGSEGSLHLVMDYRFNPKKKKMEEVCISVYETNTMGDYHASQRAEMIWEYMRLYMDQGAAALPPFADDSKSEYGLDHVSEAFTLWGGIIKMVLGMFFSPKQTAKNIVGLFRENGFFGGISNLLALTLLSVIAIPYSLLSIPTELFYMGLERILPCRKWPKELLEACNYIWDGSNDHGPTSEPALEAFDFNAARSAQHRP